jgi:hypothetical protein
VIQALRLFDRKVVNGGVPESHQTMFIKLPILITVGTKPIVRIIVPFVGEAHRNAISVVSPKLFNQIDMIGFFPSLR